MCEHGILKEIRSMINGIDIREGLPQMAIDKAKENNVVIAFGASDDLLELRGAIHDEIGAYDGVNFEDLEIDETPRDIYNFMWNNGVNLLWCPDKEKSWAFEVAQNVKVERFCIMEDFETFCEGIILFRNPL